MTVSVDTSEVRTLAADLRQIDGRLTRHIRPVMAKAAVNVKKAMQEDLQGSSNKGIQKIARAVSYDFTSYFGFGGGEMVVEIGPVKRAGALANIAYFGTSKGGGTVRDPKEALGDEEPNLLRELESLVERLVLG